MTRGCVQISKSLTHYAAIALFIFFGLRSLHDAFAASESVSPPTYAPIESELKHACFYVCLPSS